MRRGGARGVLGFALFSLVTVALCAALGLVVYEGAKDARQSDAENVLASFRQAMELKLKGSLGGTGDFVAALSVDPEDEGWLSAAAGALLERDEVVSVLYVVGDTMRYAFPEDAFGDMVGCDLTQFNYVFTLAKWIDGFVVEGPVTVANGEKCFMFVEPVDVDGAYYGEVAVALKASYVVEQLDFALLEESGYLYELWAVSPQDGRKDVIAVSEGGRDFSHAAKTTFSMPTEWTLSVMPEDGWVPGSWTAGIAAASAALALLVIGCVFMGLRISRMSRQIEEERRIDQETGMLTCDGLVETLAEEGRGPDDPLTLICLMVDDFEETAFAMGWDARRSYLGAVADGIDDVVRGSHLSVRVGSGSFVVAVRERMDKHALADAMRSLELALMWKARVGDRKSFCRARSAAVCYPEDGDDLIALVERTISLLERDKPEEFEPKRKRRG